MPAGPVTWVVLIVLVALLCGGLMLLRRALRRPTAFGGSAPCPKCRHVNPADARFCSRCGAAVS